MVSKLHICLLHVVQCDRQEHSQLGNVHTRGGGGTSSNFRSTSSARQKNWTQSDLRFCENEGSKRFKINEKGINWIKH